MDHIQNMNVNGFPMPVPQMLNHQPPPPQIFTSYNAGLPPGLDMQEMTGQMFGDPNLLEDSNEAKRRRIARACDMCRKKKIKCDGKLPSCTHCINYKTECIFTQVEKKRNPPKGAKYIEGLENRLGRMEKLLRLSGLIEEDDNGRTDLGTLEKKLQHQDFSRRASLAVHDDPSSPTQLDSKLDPTDRNATPTRHDHSHTPDGHAASPAVTAKSKDTNATKEKDVTKEDNKISSKDKVGDKDDAEHAPTKSPQEVEALSDMMCSLVTNNCGETRYIGSSSGFSIFSPKGIQWVNEKTGDSSFQAMIQEASVDDNKWIYWKPDVFSDIFERRVFHALPQKNECLSLLTDFFENFNCMFPLFHQPTFMHLVERHYSPDPYEGSGWWASLNVALAIAHRLRVMSNLVPAEEDQKAWGYLKNAMAVQTELTMRNTDLLSVQALLGMALFMQGTPNPQPSFFLVSAAIRLSHSIGLHKRGAAFNLNPVEIEQRKRVFWIGYMLDKDICLRSGRPPAQDDDDMNVDLPSADPEDNIGNIPLADGKGKLNLFRLMAEFAVIESNVTRRLYSTKASKQSDGELLNTIGELDKELEDWKDSIPVDFRPEHEIKASHTPLILHIVVLHFSYYNCLTTIHRMSIHHGYWTSRLSNYAIQGLNAKPLNPRIFSSAALCVSAARASIHLIKYVPQGDFACVWLVLYFPVSSLVTLFGNILQNPSDPRARSDIRLMNLVVAFLSMLGNDAEHGGVKRMLGICTEFERIAKVVVDKAEKDTTTRRKRKPAEDTATKSNNIAMLSADISNMNRRPSVMASNMFAQPNLTPQHVHMPMPDHISPRQNGNMANSVSPQAMSNQYYANDAHLQQQQPQQPHVDYNHPEYMSPTGMTPYADIQAYTQTNASNAYANSSPLNNMNAFAQPFVPQDLWQMPMTLDWDWAEMTAGAYEGGAYGVGGDGIMNGEFLPGNGMLGQSGVLPLSGMGNGADGRR